MFLPHAVDQLVEVEVEVEAEAGGLQSYWQFAPQSCCGRRPPVYSGWPKLKLPAFIPLGWAAIPSLDLLPFRH